MTNVFCLRIILFCVLAGILTGCTAPKKSCCCQMTAAPAVTDHLTGKSILEPDSIWHGDDGKDFRLAELRGHPVVISMFYASCEGVCIITKDDMKAVEASLPAAVRERTEFVLVTLAPDLDTPAVLQAYRVEQGLSANRWRLLCGSPAATAQLARRLGIGYGRDASGIFRHSSEITVLDESGKIVLRQDGIHADLAETVKVLAAGRENQQDQDNFVQGRTK
jgi:protein SCO1/2